MNDVVFEPEAGAPNKLAKQAVNVHKFGGSSLASKECIERVIDIIGEHCQLADFVVVSANGKTTDGLFNLIELARSNNDDLADAIVELAKQQSTLIEELIQPSHINRLETLLAEDIKQLSEWLHINVNAHQSDILAFGELWSARLLSAVLNERICPSTHLDARDFLVIDDAQSYNVDYSSSLANLNQLKQRHKLTVVTGYICRDKNGVTCTLGRNGSDYSATIMAALNKAANVTLWTDVDGIYSADPRIVPSSRKLNRLPKGVARELGRLGNPVLHENTLKPLAEHKCHLHVASSFAPEVSGTEIGNFGQIAKQELSVTILNDLIQATSESLSDALFEKVVNEFKVVASVEEQQSVIIRQEQQKLLSQTLASYGKEVLFEPVAMIAVVGHKVAKRGDIKARFKRALTTAQAKYFVESEAHSVIAVLPENCSVETLNHVHHDMTKDAKHIGLVVAGLGNIGQRFLELLPKQLTLPQLENTHLVGLVSSKQALINTDGIDVKQAVELFKAKACDYTGEQLFEWLSSHPYDELIVVDITPSETFSLLYKEFFARGIHVIGANKWAASSSTQAYDELLALSKEHGSLWRGNTTVGAGLPINYAINDLRRSGDDITEIAGVFSGTLSWLFEKYDGSQPFSELMLNALELGLTEPDPREDLSGRDVQRKLLILARAAGFTLSLEDIDCQNLVPEALQSISTSDFLARANELDDYFASQVTSASEQDLCIRYVARFQSTENGVSAKVSLEQLPKTDAFANLTPCDNIFQVTSNWYQENPLIIRGPGAGRDVTAGGIHSDLAAICQQLIHRRPNVKIKSIVD